MGHMNVQHKDVGLAGALSPFSIGCPAHGDLQLHYWPTNWRQHLSGTWVWTVSSGRPRGLKLDPDHPAKRD